MYISTNVIVFVMMLMCTVQLVTCTRQTSYPKLCFEERKYHKTVTIMEKQPVRVRKYEWCLSVPYRCSKYVTQVQTVEKTETIEKTANITVCCPGFEESPDGKECFPTCDPECQNGVCDSPGNCTCDVGYTGENCNQLCDKDFYGMNCTETCKCQNGGTCHHITGDCNCTVGWMGRVCEEASRQDTHKFENEKAATDLSTNSNQDNFVLFNVKVSSDKLAELSKKFANGDWILSVSARHVNATEEPVSQMDSDSLEGY